MSYQHKQSGTIVRDPYKENRYLRKRLITLWNKYQQQQIPNKLLDADQESTGLYDIDEEGNASKVEGASKLNEIPVR